MVHNYGKVCSNCGNHQTVNKSDVCAVTGKRITQTKWTTIYEVGCASFAVKQDCGSINQNGFQHFSSHEPINQDDIVIDLSHIKPERRGCLTCMSTECPIWQGVDRNCWKSQAEYCATITANVTEEVLDEIIHKYDSGDHPKISDCDTTDEWYGHGWDDCREGFVKHLKSMRSERQHEGVQPE